jgi:hypothetical protein
LPAGPSGNNYRLYLRKFELLSRNEQQKLIKTYPLAEMLEKDEFLHNQAEYANSPDRESGNLQYSPIRLLYYGTE